MLACVCCLALSSCARILPEPPRAIAGVLDLRGWDFSRNGEVELSGEWLFHPGVLLGGEAALTAAGGSARLVPDLWRGTDAAGTDGRGAGTYRLRILLPTQRPELAIRFSTVSTAFELEADGSLRASAGKPAVLPQLAEPGCRPGVVALVEPREETTLTVRVSNHEYRSGGMWRAFRLGERAELERARNTERTISIILFAFFSAIAFNSLTVYLFRNKETSQLAFSLFTLVLAFRPLVTGDFPIVEALPGLPFSWLIRSIYLASFLPVPLAADFISRMFPDLATKRLKLLMTAPALPFILAAIAAPLPVLTSIIFPFYGVAVFCLSALFFAVLVPAVARKLPDSTAVAFSGAVMLAAGINDILYASFTIQTGYFLPYGLAVMVAIQAAILSRRFTKAFDTAEELSAAISRTNGILEAEIESRKSIQDQLEASLREKESLLRNVHHWVRNSLQIVSSVISLESNRTRDSLQIERYANIKARIRSIGLVHERLYEAKSTDRLELRSVIEELVDILTDSFAGECDCVPELRAQPLLVSPRVCIDAGLILTELVSNSFKFAILPRGNGRITVDASHEGSELILRVTDDGPGFPPEFDPFRARSIGYRLLMSMVASYDGGCEIRPGSGACVEIRLRISDSLDKLY